MLPWKQISTLSSSCFPCCSHDLPTSTAIVFFLSSGVPNVSMMRLSPFYFCISDLLPRMRVCLYCWFCCAAVGFRTSLFHRSVFGQMAFALFVWFALLLFRLNLTNCFVCPQCWLCFCVVRGVTPCGFSGDIYFPASSDDLFMYSLCFSRTCFSCLFCYKAAVGGIIFCLQLFRLTRQIAVIICADSWKWRFVLVSPSSASSQV